MLLLMCLRVGCRVAEHLDVIEHILPCSVARQVYPSPFQELEEALSNTIVMTIPTSTHTGYQIVFTEERLPLFAGKL